MKKRLKLNGVLIFLGVALAFCFPEVFLRQSANNLWNDFAQIWGFIFILGGMLLRISARGYKSQNSKEGFALVRGGLYEFVRNPMYLGIIMSGLGIVLVLFRWWVALLFTFIFILRYVRLIVKEENMLLSRFGKDYQAYMNSTPRLLPRAGSIAREDIRKILPLKLLWIKKEIGTAVAVVAGILLVKFWQDMRTGRFLEYMKGLAIFAVIAVFFLIFVFYLNNSKIEDDKRN